MTRASETRLEAMRTAILECDAQEIRALLGRGADVKTRDELGEMPLIWAVSSGSLDIAHLLIEAGAEIDARDNRKATPLLWAAANGRLEMVWLLVERGADVNAREDLGETAVSKAAVNGHFRIVRFLIEKGAKVAENDLLHVKDPEIIGLLREALRKS
jgi:ankyrin repeat protein